MLHVCSEAINHPYLVVTSLFSPSDGARVPLANGVLCQTLTDALQPCPAPRFIIWDFSYLQTQLHCTQIRSSAGTSSRPRDVSYGEQHCCLPFCLPSKTQRPSFLSSQEQFYQLYSTFHRWRRQQTATLAWEHREQHTA